MRAPPGRTSGAALGPCAILSHARAFVLNRAPLSPRRGGALRLPPRLHEMVFEALVSLPKTP